MSEPQQLTAEMSRQELISAIDYEIAHRDSALARHGVTTWGMAAAIVALLWVLINEAPGHTYNGIHILLVMLTGRWILHLLCSPILKALAFGNVVTSQRRRTTFREVLALSGADPETIGYNLLDTLAMGGIGVFLAFNGFLLLGVVTAVQYSLLAAILAVSLVSCRIRLPLAIMPSGLGVPEAPNARVLSRVLMVVLIVVPIWALFSVWGDVGLNDLRLGAIISALLMMAGMTVGLLRPPVTTSRLRSIRTRLASGRMTVDAARLEAESIMHGAPEEEYLTAKADSLIEEWEAYRQFCESLCRDAARLVAAGRILLEMSAEQRRAHAKAIAEEFRPIMWTVRGFNKSIDRRRKRLEKLRREFDVRVQAAKLFTSIPNEVLTAQLERVNAEQTTVQQALQQAANFGPDFDKAMHCVYESVMPQQKKIRLAEFYAAAFSS